ncbi:MAG: hypothetical protein ACU88J_10155 [Gammaproteobacteria bacterium]
MEKFSGLGLTPSDIVTIHITGSDEPVCHDLEAQTDTDTEQDTRTPVKEIYKPGAGLWERCVAVSVEIQKRIVEIPADQVDAWFQE